ncbi:Wzy polymerase domain-containing protein [Vibrio sp. Of7-15]|uniref:PglL family O-oligosaccharyltransferase n=1 Tax=Vibrio sp. Of7-15 TaxID=2724879 RepID=UPI001EF29BDE|nr:Wzy polymerase domain-containing protein [Vibrio sp. Of7-15]MCG7498495.1 Wzy polymerase domain-containing protein [Vibrio sp. Of7-15]
MAILHIQGTQLAAKTQGLPLTRYFLASLALLFLVAMHVFQPNPGGSGLHLSFNASSWIPLSIAIAFALYHTANQGAIKYTRLTLVLLCSCLLLTVPIFYADAQPELVLSRLTGVWAGFLFFVLLQQFAFNNKQRQFLLWLIVIATLIEASFGYVQYLLLEPNNPFGYNTFANRPYGIFQQPNVMASFLTTGLVLSSYLLARQSVKYDNNKIATFILFITPIILIPLLVVLASRTGWLSAFITIALISPYMWRYTNKKRFYLWGSSLLTGLILSYSVIQLHSLKNASTQQLLSHKTTLESARQFTYPQTLDMVLEKPYTGYGYGRFEAEYTLYTAKQHALNPNYHPGLPSMDHPHNEFLFWAVEGGMIPVIGLILAGCYIFIRIHHSSNGSRLALLALLTPIMLHSLLEYPFYHSAPHWFTFIILVYWIEQLSAKYKKVAIHLPSKVLFRVSSLVIPIVTTAYMLSVLHTNWVLTKFETSRPPQPDILLQVTNPVVWEDRFNWDIFSTQLAIGLQQNKPEYIQPYINWSKDIILNKPRPAFYKNLILAYQGVGEREMAEEIRNEARYLFPKVDFSLVNLPSGLSKASSAAE